VSLIAEVVDVVQASDLTRLDGCHLDLPLTGHQPEPGRLSVSGWVLGANSPVVATEVHHREAVVARSASLGERRDVAEVFPGHPGADRAGFHLTVAGIWNEPIDLQVVAVLADRSRCHIGSIRVRAGSTGENTPLVSVVIPCYGQAHFLPDAITSVLSQTYPNVEVIVVDDGSPDNVAAVVAQYPGVRCVRQDNRGLPGARNSGLRESTGDFLVFLDADDRLLPAALRAGLDWFDQCPGCGLVSGCFRVIDSEGRLWFVPEQPRIPDDHYRALLGNNFITVPATCMYRRLVLDEVGGFDETFRGSADYELYLRIARSFPLHLHDTPVADYRRGAHNMSINSQLMFSDVMRVARRQRRYVSGRKKLRLAYIEGLAHWRRSYGSSMIEQIDAALAVRDRRRAIRGIVTLVQYDLKSPPRLVRHILKRKLLRPAKAHVTR
jgi:glycosyltransferase involved in cell wall biosynthesis